MENTQILYKRSIFMHHKNVTAHSNTPYAIF